LLLSGAAQAIETDNKPSMKVFGTARAPIGYALFCSTQPAECSGKGSKSARVALDAARFEELDRLNRSINQQIIPVTDAELYGVAERWAYPVTQGDCEDYVLLKRRMLIQNGWDPAALLITVVRDLKGAGHAVLTVVTDQGDYVLDNQRDVLLLWQATGYEFIKRQSQNDPKAWVYVGPARSESGVASTR
jgi:predicted transglutaminase-like cysteine proteinase